MDQMAENTPEVEIETDASEQIPDDVELAEEVETADGSESSGNDAEEATDTDDDESEQEFYFGDEKLDSPTSGNERKRRVPQRFSRKQPITCIE